MLPQIRPPCQDGNAVDEVIIEGPFSAEYCPTEHLHHVKRGSSCVWYALLIPLLPLFPTSFNSPCALPFFALAHVGGIILQAVNAIMAGRDIVDALEESAPNLHNHNHKHAAVRLLCACACG